MSDETAAVQPRPAWEYVAVPIPVAADQGNPTADLTNHLNGMGSDGWELVAIVDRSMVFKRPKARETTATPVIRPW